MIREGKRCFVYCGDDRCDCEAAVLHIVERVTGDFRRELDKINASQRVKRKAAGTVNRA